MSKNITRNYEGMFLISQAVAADFGGAVSHIRDILNNAGVEIIAMKKWDERRLAYEIDKQKRGVYILAYFSGSPEALVKIENWCNLSERILRAMFLRVDHLTEEEMRSADERQALEDEARLRAEERESAQSAEGVSRAEASDEDDEAVAVGADEDEDED